MARADAALMSTSNARPQVAIASATAWKATFGESMSIRPIKKRARVSSFSTDFAAQSDCSYENQGVSLLHRH
jgi:hypothetical protein